MNIDATLETYKISEDEANYNKVIRAFLTLTHEENRDLTRKLLAKVKTRDDLDVSDDTTDNMVKELWCQYSDPTFAVVTPNFINRLDDNAKFHPNQGVGTEIPKLSVPEFYKVIYKNIPKYRKAVLNFRSKITGGGDGHEWEIQKYLIAIEKHFAYIYLADSQAQWVLYDYSGVVPKRFQMESGKSMRSIQNSSHEKAQSKNKLQEDVISAVNGLGKTLQSVHLRSQVEILRDIAELTTHLETASSGNNEYRQFLVESLAALKQELHERNAAFSKNRS
jgi:hypothetical protein